MDDAEGREEIFLKPGELYFGGDDTRIRTLLGSCVAVTLWHPIRRIGGMCHYVVPTRHDPSRRRELSGHYADEALLLLLREIDCSATLASEYQVKMFGGGNQWQGLTGSGPDIARRNVEAGQALLRQHNLTLTSMHLGGTGHRQVALDLWSGSVWVKHVERREEVSAP